jgi:hypothetical protein
MYFALIFTHSNIINPIIYTKINHQHVALESIFKQLKK